VQGVVVAIAHSDAAMGGRCRAVLKGRTGRALFSRVSGQLVQNTLY
jgi:hypothetical protein